MKREQPREAGEGAWAVAFGVRGAAYHSRSVVPMTNEQALPSERFRGPFLLSSPSSCAHRGVHSLSSSFHSVLSIRDIGIQRLLPLRDPLLGGSRPTSLSVAESKWVSAYMVSV